MKHLFFGFLLFFALAYLGFTEGLGPFLFKHLEKMLYQEVLKGNRDFMHGYFHVMIGHLLETTPSDWSKQLAQWRPHFGYNIALLPMDITAFSPQELKEIEKGLIFMRGDSDVSENIYYQRIGRSAFVLQFGPIAPEDEMPSVWKPINKATLLALICFVGVMTLLWSYPFWGQLKRIRAAARAFGQGDLGVRINPSKRSTLFPIAGTFDHMADRIQQLVTSHRELTRAVSHELRTPLARLRFHLEMLQSSGQPDDRMRHKKGIRKDLDELDTLIEELTTFARFDGIQPGLSKESHPLIPWINEIIETIRIDLQTKHFDLHLTPGDIPQTARFDPKFMGRALTNLLGNAVKYGCSRVELTAMRQDDQLFLIVDDDGPGIPDADQARIFDPFTRLETSRSRESGGFGLGLAIVKQVIEWHGGMVSVAKSPLGGARFCLAWPGTENSSRG